jgi:CCR4-NOT transcription complex subunit 7/8
MKVARIGPQHQAGSDSLLTHLTFFKMRQSFFDDAIDESKYLGHLYGLGMFLACACVLTTPTGSSSTSNRHDDNTIGGGGSNSNSKSQIISTSTANDVATSVIASMASTSVKMASS